MSIQRGKKKQVRRTAVRQRVRRRVRGTPGRPRLAVFRSDRHLHLQVIDDVEGKTLASLSTLEAAFREQGFQHGATVSAASAAGKLIGERARDAGVSKVVFDRGGYAYHGRVRAIADAAREAGLEF